MGDLNPITQIAAGPAGKVVERRRGIGINQFIALTREPVGHVFHIPDNPQQLFLAKDFLA